MKKIGTKITDANGGMHDVRAYKNGIAMLQGHGYSSPRLYHLCLMDSEQVKPYQDAIKALCAELRKRKMPCQYRAAVEVDEEKGLHMHIFILVEAKHANPCDLLNRKHYGWLERMLLRKELGFHLNHPRNPLHWGKDGSKRNYASLPPSKPEKLADAVEWVSYLYKNRSKPNLPQIYFSSRPTREILK